MSNSQLPIRPNVTIPSLQDAKGSHGDLSTKQVNQSSKCTDSSKKDQEHTGRCEFPICSPQAGQKRTCPDRDSEDATQKASKKIKSLAPPSTQSQLLRAPKLGSSSYLQIPALVFDQEGRSPTGSCTPTVDFAPASPPNVQYDKATGAFITDQPEQATPTCSISSKNDLLGLSKMKKKSTETVMTAKVDKPKPVPEYYSRKRSAAQLSEDDEDPPEFNDTTALGPQMHVVKHIKLDDDAEEIDVRTNTLAQVSSKKRTDNFRIRQCKNAKTETARDMRLKDLIPHYAPSPEAFTRVQVGGAARPRAPALTIMDFPSEVRLHIWGKVFEDEAYRFTIKKYCSRDSPKHMLPRKPASHGCIFIHPSLAAEVSEQMYKSVRLELDFGRLRPHAMRAFINQIANHRLGRECQRIYFIKKFGFQKVNTGVFISAREIVSTDWTVEGSNRTEDDDHKDELLDPEHVLYGPPSHAGKLKGLKERRFWRDQEAAFERYKRHMEGWCHPEAQRPYQTVKVSDSKHSELMIEKLLEVERKPCPFEDKCLNLKDTKFCIMFKYKFGCINARQLRHKEVHYKYWPSRDELKQLGVPESKFHKSSSKTSP